MNSTVLQAVPSLPPLADRPCPSWCADRDHAADFDQVAGTRSPMHHAIPSFVTAVDPDDPTRECLHRPVTVRLSRFDMNDEPGQDAISVAGIDGDDFMRIEDAEHLAQLLLRFVAISRAERSAIHPCIRMLEAAGPVLVCRDCGAEFHADSSPSFDLCWVCDEKAGAEMGVAR